MVVTVYIDTFSFVTDEGDDCMQFNWVDAFQKCCKTTQHALIPPKPVVKRSAGNLNADTHSSVMSILASGLPMPKSPSLRIEEQVATSRQVQEREERGWWTLRFYQVMSELRRRDELVNEFHSKDLGQ